MNILYLTCRHKTTEFLKVEGRFNSNAADLACVTFHNDGIGNAGSESGNGVEGEVGPHIEKVRALQT
jgi:hypothetical protein